VDTDSGGASGRVLGMNWRPDFDPAVVHRELTIIRDDLHCNAVRLCGRDLGRLGIAAEDALQQGLEVWLSPELWDKDQEATLKYLTKAAAAAEQLHTRWPGRVVLSVASEATLFTQGIIPGRTLSQWLAYLFREYKQGGQVAPLQSFLARAAAAAREVLHGELTYASLIFEKVDWSLFDIVGVDHYRDARVKDRYIEMLQPLLAHGKPVVVTEFGARAYKGADTSGTLGFGVTDTTSLALHRLPVVGRFVRPHLKKGHYIRDEASQAHEIAETLGILEGAGVHGAFVCTFVEQLSLYSEDPHYDLDMSALSLVKTYAKGHGATYPDMTWEPKQSFSAVADFYAYHQDPTEQTTR
jgi:hypothetical protein